MSYSWPSRLVSFHVEDRARSMPIWCICINCVCIVPSFFQPFSFLPGMAYGLALVRLLTTTPSLCIDRHGECVHPRSCASAWRNSRHCLSDVCSFLLFLLNIFQISPLLCGSASIIYSTMSGFNFSLYHNNYYHLSFPDLVTLLIVHTHSQADHTCVYSMRML